MANDDSGRETRNFGARELILNHNVWEEVFTYILSIVTQLRHTHHPWHLMAVNYGTIWLNTPWIWGTLITGVIKFHYLSSQTPAEWNQEAKTLAFMGWKRH